MSTRSTSRFVTRALRAAAVCVLLLPRSALADGSCLDALVWEGPPEAVAEVRSLLQHGSLGREGLHRCLDADVLLRPSGEGYEIRLTRDEREAHHTVASLSAVAVWIESWMLPVPMEVEAPVGDVAPPVDVESPPIAPPPVETREPPTADPPAVPLRFGGAVLLDGSVVGRAAVGAEITGAVKVGRVATLGFSLAGQWSPEQNQIQRRALLATIRALGLVSMGKARLHVGGGVGIVSAHAERETSDGLEADDTEAGPVVEAIAMVATPLTDSLSLDVGIGVRLFLPDELRDEMQDAEELLDPEPLPHASAFLTLGLAWEREGFR